MIRYLLSGIILISFHQCLTLTTYITDTEYLDNGAIYQTYSSREFTLSIHVIMIPLDTFNIRLIPALGQREEVSSIANRNNAYIAVNGCNYRRGGKYNGNRVNLLYLNNRIYSDLKLFRGCFGWNSVTKRAIIDRIFLQTNLYINGQSLVVDQINQPRMTGKCVLYTDIADMFLLSHTPGKNIIINNNTITDITYNLPYPIENNYIYQVDPEALPFLKQGMQVDLNFRLISDDIATDYNDYDFIIGGAGLLIHNRKIVPAQLLHQEFCQGTEIVHCNDEIAADFHTHDMQQWLIEQRHPRTAIGITETNNICIVVVDGRQPDSGGLTLKELAEFMHKHKCVNALNIGGGGCSTMYIKNKIVNIPSTDAFAKKLGAERPVSEALCFFKI